MPQPTGSIRKLSYPLTFTEDMESVVGPEPINNIDLSLWSNPDPDVPVDIVLRLSLNEYVALASTIDVGRDIAYGDNSIFIWWLWVRSLESMAICQAVLDCINTNTDIQEAIAGYALGSSINGLSPIDGTIPSTVIIQDNVGCDDDNLFGAITGIVDLYNNLARDIIQVLVANTNLIGRAGDIIESIPVIGTLPFDDILQFTENFITDFEQNYQAAYTDILRDEFRCDLFCLYQGDCSFTFQDVFDYYNGRLLNPHLTTDPLALILYLTTNQFLGEQLVFAFNMMVAGLFLFAGDLVDVNSQKLIAMVSALFNDPDSDWVLLCTNCGWTYNCDFVVDNCGWVAFQDSAPYDDPNGVWNMGSGWDTTDLQQFASNWARTSSPLINFTATNITSITMIYDFTIGFWEQVSQVTIFIQGWLSGAVVFTDVVNRPLPADGTGLQFVSSPNTTLDRIRILVRPSTDVGDGSQLSGFSVIKSVQITGTGTNPF